jgi:putative hydrolase of the HAD superfamily
MPPHAILFDLDNTLIDRPRSLSRLSARLYEHFAPDLGPLTLADLDAAVQRADGGGYRPKDEAFAELRDTLPWLRRPDVETIHEVWYTHYPQSAVPLPGMYEMLDQIDALSIPMGIITNGGSFVQNAKVDLLDLRRRMAVVVVSDDVGVRKPDPAIFELALDRANVAPAHAWFVGDHPINDILGAANAGLTPVWMRGSHDWPSDAPPPQLQIDTLDELVEHAVRD